MIALASVLVVSFAGCGDDGPADRTAGLTPEELIRQSRAAAEAVVAFRLGGEATVTADIAPGTLPKLAADAFDGPVAIDGEGPVNGDDVSFDFDTAVQGLPPLQANLTKVGGQLFAGVLGTDYRIPLPRALVAAIVPARLPSTLLSWVAAPTEVGREDVDGVPTVHVRATIDTDQALDDLAPVLASVAGGELTARDRTLLAEALTTRTIDLWIGSADLIPRRISVDLDYRGGVRRLAAIRTVRLTFTVGFAKIGEPVAITAPETTNVLDLDRLRSLAGG